MDLIAGRKTEGIMTGAIQYNGIAMGQASSKIAYVQVTDVHVGEFTVLQNMYYSARLRLGTKLSDEDIATRIFAAVDSVGLRSALDVCVGSELTKGISGGQKKRLSIAVELLALPDILCLDEPTSGLNYNAYAANSLNVFLSQCLCQ